MKKIIFTMAMSFCMVAGFAQLKVVSNGNTVVGGTDPGQGNFKTRGTSELELALDAVTGNADFTMQLNNVSKAQFKYNVGLQGVEFLADQANGGDFGLAASAFAMFISGTNQRVGVGINTPASRLHVNGVITYAGGSIGSDRRLKTDIQDYEGGLDKILKLQPKTYHYNGKAGIDSDQLQVGIIAQDLQEIAPEFVGSFQYRDVKYSDNTEETSIGATEEYLTVNAQAVQFMLVNAVKEQQKLIEEKDDRIYDLEAKLLALEDKVNEIVNQYDVNLGGGLSDAGLGQNIPNPFNGETQITYSIPEKATSASMNIYDLNGRLLKTISISHTGKGNLNVNADQLPAGTYSYQLVVDNQIIGAKKMIKGN